MSPQEPEIEKPMVVLQVEQPVIVSTPSVAPAPVFVEQKPKEAIIVPTVATKPVVPSIETSLLSSSIADSNSILQDVAEDVDSSSTEVTPRSQNTTQSQESDIPKLLYGLSPDSLASK